MKAIIPVAGKGSRLRPHTHTQAKPLLWVADRPILDHVLAPLADVDIDEVIFVVGHLGDQIRAHVHDNYPFKSTFVQQDELLGLGYAVHLALQATDDVPMLVVLGDTVAETEMATFVGYDSNALGVRQVSDPSRFGIVELGDGGVIDMEEKPSKPKSDLALIGLYYFQQTSRLRDALEKLVASEKKTRGEYQLTDALKTMLLGGEIFVPHEVAAWHDCGKKETLLESNRALLADLPVPSVIDGAEIVPPVYLGPDVRISNAVIGPHVSLGAGSVVNGGRLTEAIVGSKTTLINCELSNSLIGKECMVRGAKGELSIGDHSQVDA